MTCILHLKSWRALALGLQIAFLVPAGISGAGVPYPPVVERVASQGNTTYFIDPVSGNDAASGLKREEAWRGFHNVNRLLLAPGDKVEIIAPGKFDHTLSLAGAGTAEAPVEVRFAPGRYDLDPMHAYRHAWQISNTNDDPEGLKAAGILLAGARHFHVSGPDARLVCRGKMIMVVVDGCRDVTISGLGFDYHRPTVSEFRVVRAEMDEALIEIHHESDHVLRDDTILWKGEGWSHNWGLAQELSPETSRVRRMRDPLAGLAVTRPGAGESGLLVSGPHELKDGHIYQIRDPFRDCAGFFTQGSSRITWKDLRIYFMHGMGMVSQFSEDLTFDSVSIKPENGSKRTTAAWADCLHFSGCRGRIVIRDCEFDGAHDDAVNVHGTHLSVVERLPGNRVRARFMHKQTFGFAAFHAGDEVEFVRPETLETYGPNRITAAEPVNPKEMLLTLEHALPDDFRIGDAIENVTWTPEVEIRGCSVARIPTRGFLVTTRRPVVIENNFFNRTHMSAILIENDAKGWFESGPVRDMLIRNNRFMECGEPVIHINPQNTQPNPAVHRNIRIENNLFRNVGSRAIRAGSTTGLRITGNEMRVQGQAAPGSLIETKDCADVVID